MNQVQSISARRPEVEVSAKAKRRRFSAEYKRKIIEEVAACTGERGAVSAVLRREGLYSSHLTEWRESMRSGGLAALTPKRRGPKSAQPDARDKKLAEQEREIVRLRARAERAEALVALQKKVSELLGIPLPEPESNGRRS
jgi:transposase-like protein